MLLTQSHTSILLSTAIILFFTAALFLSGFAIQRRSMRDLRIAIKPQSDLLSQTRPPLVDLAQPYRSHAAGPPHDDMVPTLGEYDAQRTAREIEALLRGGAAGFDKPGVSPARVVDANAHGNRGVLLDQNNPDPSAQDQEPISRAKRRRLIKEELQRLAQDDTQLYPRQRRPW